MPDGPNTMSPGVGEATVDVVEVVNLLDCVPRPIARLAGLSHPHWKYRLR